MKILEYVNEVTFEKTNQKFEDFHYELAENIKSVIHNIYKVNSITNIMSNKEGNKLLIGVMKNRNNGEEIAEKYRITIEKI